MIGPKAGGEPVGEVASDIKKTFGSGWAWLSVFNDGKLEISSMANQDSPIMEGKTLTINQPRRNEHENND